MHTIQRMHRVGSLVIKPTLTDASIAPSTAKAYGAATTKFIEWMLQYHDAAISSITDIHQFDNYFSAYLVHLYDMEVGKVAASQAFFGLNLLTPGITRMMPRSTKSLKGYHRLIPSKSHPPLTWPCTVMIALTMARNGNVQAGIATLLAFDSYLRIGELLGLRREDVAYGGDPRLKAGPINNVYIRLRRTKAGVEQSVIINNADVKVLVLSLCDTVAPNTLLFPYTTNSYRRLFKRVVAFWGLSSLYTPHSLRHGGCLYDHLNGVPISDIQHRGRWQQQKTAYRYIQSFTQAAMAMTIPPSLTSSANILFSTGLSLIDLMITSINYYYNR